jgi:hypothetical protein
MFLLVAGGAFRGLGDAKENFRNGWVRRLRKKLGREV